MLSKIWTLSDSQAPKGQLNQSEFFIALKLIALKQAGQAPSIDAINAVTDLPDLGDKTTEAKAIVAVRLRGGCPMGGWQCLFSLCVPEGVSTLAQHT